MPQSGGAPFAACFLTQSVPTVGTVHMETCRPRQLSIPCHRHAINARQKVITGQDISRHLCRLLCRDQALQSPFCAGLYQLTWSGLKPTTRDIADQNRCRLPWFLHDEVAQSPYMRTVRLNTYNCTLQSGNSALPVPCRASRENSLYLKPSDEYDAQAICIIG